MNRIFKIAIAMFLAFSLMFMTGCSSVSTAPDEAALHYSGGSFSSKTFEDCVGPSTREFNGPGDSHAYYPDGQRTFSFTGAKGAERGPIAVTTKDGQEVLVPGLVTFTLNTECDTLREFHERIGSKYKAFSEESGQQGPGWADFLSDYINTPLDAAMNEASLQAAGWYSLYSNADTQADFEAYVKENLPEEIENALGDDFITINAVQISKPTVGDGLKDGLAAKEEARLQNEAQKEKNLVASTKYDSLADCRQAGLSENACITVYLAESGDIPFYPIPQGSGLNVNPS